MITVDYLRSLFPSIYDTSSGTNISKILEVISEGFADLITDINAIIELKEISTIAGINLTRWAADYGIERGDFTDALLRILLNASLNNDIAGATIPKILNFFGYLYTNYHIVELHRDELGHRLDGSRLLDGTHVLDGAGISRPLAFDVIIEDPISNLTFLENMLNDLLKAGGVRATINLLLAGAYGVGDYGAEYYGEGESGYYVA